MIQSIFNGSDITKLSPPEIEGAVRRAAILYGRLKETEASFKVMESPASLVAFEKALPVIREAIAEKLILDDTFTVEATYDCYDKALSCLRMSSLFLSNSLEGTKEFPKVYADPQAFFEKYQDVIEREGYPVACQKAYLDAVGVKTLVKDVPAVDKEYLEILSDGGYDAKDISRFFDDMNYKELSEMNLPEVGEVWLPEPIPLYKGHEDTDEEIVENRPVDAWRMIGNEKHYELYLHHAGDREQGWEEVNSALRMPPGGREPVEPLRGHDDNALQRGVPYRTYRLLWLSSILLRKHDELSVDLEYGLDKELIENNGEVSQMVVPDMSFLNNPKACMDYFGSAWADLIKDAFNADNKGKSLFVFLSPRGQCELFTRKRFPVYDTLILSLHQLCGKGSPLWAEHGELEKRGIETSSKGLLLLSIDKNNGGEFTAHRVFGMKEISFNLGAKYREFKATDYDSEAKYNYAVGSEEYYNKCTELADELMTAYQEKYPSAGELEMRLAEVVFRQEVGGSIARLPLSEETIASLSSADASSMVFSCLINTATRASNLMKEKNIALRLDSILPKEVIAEMTGEKKPDDPTPEASAEYGI